jgi:biopolymer transport protein ExbD
MKFKRHVEIVKGRPDLTALVNVVLLLVFFFLLSSAFVQQPGIKIDLPGSLTVATLPYKSLVVMLTGPDEAYFQNTKMTLSDLRPLLESASKQSTDQQIVIQSDGRVPYQTIVEVMNMAFEFRFRAVNLATRAQISAPPTR